MDADHGGNQLEGDSGVTIKIPELPALSSRVPTEVRNALIKLHQALKSADASGGLATAADVSGASSSIASDVADAIAEITTGPSAVPEAPVNFTATGAFNQILLKVDSPNQDDQVEYTEFLRATVDDPNQADVVARISGTSYPDTPPDSRLSVNYYYWARFVSVIGTGPLNATAGTISSTADEPGYILDTLVADKWQAATAYDVDMVVTPGNVDGRALKCTVAGVSGASEPTWPTVIGNTVVDDGATWELVATDVTLESIFKIALVSGNWVAAIKAAFIQDLTAENFVAKEIVADKISTALAESYQQVIGWLLRSSDSLVSLDMSSKVLKMQDAGTGDYVQMTPGELEFYYDSHLYKAVRRTEAGIASSGSWVYFSSPFKTTPKVLLSWKNICTFDLANNGFTQTVNVNPTSVSVSGFYVTAQTVLSGSTFKLQSLHYPFDYGYNSSVFTLPEDAQTLYAKVTAYNSFGDYNRVYIYYKLTSASSWSLLFGGYTSAVGQVFSKAVPPGRYKMYVTTPDDSISTECANDNYACWQWAGWDTVGSTVVATGDVNWMAIEGGA